MKYVYVLRDTPKDSFYVGFTSDLKRRIKEHVSGHNKTTSRFFEKI